MAQKRHICNCSTKMDQILTRTMLTDKKGERNKWNKSEQKGICVLEGAPGLWHLFGMCFLLLPEPGRVLKNPHFFLLDRLSETFLLDQVSSICFYHSTKSRILSLNWNLMFSGWLFCRKGARIKRHQCALFSSARNSDVVIFPIEAQTRLILGN